MTGVEQTRIYIYLADISEKDTGAGQGMLYTGCERYKGPSKDTIQTEVLRNYSSGHRRVVKDGRNKHCLLFYVSVQRAVTQVQELLSLELKESRPPS